MGKTLSNMPKTFGVSEMYLILKESNTNLIAIKKSNESWKP